MYGSEKPEISVKSTVSKCTHVPPREWGSSQAAPAQCLACGSTAGGPGFKSPRPDLFNCGSYIWLSVSGRICRFSTPRIIPRTSHEYRFSHARQESRETVTCHCFCHWTASNPRNPQLFRGRSRLIHNGRLGATCQVEPWTSLVIGRWVRCVVLPRSTSHT